MKKIIRLTESDLHRIIKESVKRILREEDFGSMDGGDIGGSVGDMGGSDIPSVAEEGIDEENPIAGASNAAQSGQFTAGSGFKSNKFFKKALDHSDLCGFERV
jgi:hypothetical protein